MSLSRLWHQQGQHAKAYQLLAPIYGWFTEGFDTADLQDAKALLDALAGHYEPAERNGRLPRHLSTVALPLVSSVRSCGTDFSHPTAAIDPPL